MHSSPFVFGTSAPNSKRVPGRRSDVTAEAEGPLARARRAFGSAIGLVQQPSSEPGFSPVFSAGFTADFSALLHSIDPSLFQ